MSPPIERRVAALEAKPASTRAASAEEAQARLCALALRCGFQVQRLDVKDKAWDFKTRDAFVAFGLATFVEWTRCIPQSEWPTFICEVLDLYETFAADGPQDANTFKFYQLELLLQAK